MKLLTRSIISTMLQRIKNEKVIVLTGSRQTGKTTLCDELLPKSVNLSHTYISFDDPDERLRFNKEPITILESLDTPLVILDEVQKIPSLFDPLKYVIDKQKKKDNSKRKVFLLTGSSQLILLPKIKETMAGRIALLYLWPFSLSEVTNRNSRISQLQKIWDNHNITKKDLESITLTRASTIRSIIRITRKHQKWGGYPPVWQRQEDVEKINWLKDYRKTYLERDITDIGRVEDIDNFALAQKLLCARTGQLLSISEIARDLSLSVNTVKRYINLLTISFQCVLLYPYYENIGKRFVKSPKVYFPDVGLNNVILGEMAIDSGYSFESWVLSEIIKWKQLQPIEPELYFFRTGAGMEIDFLLKGMDVLLPIEVKRTSKVGNVAGRNIERFMAAHKRKSPIGLVVYTGNEMVEIRKNIWAVPDWALFSGWT